ncbi:MAG: MFS transporter, partial [Muribaculaceae bacterium]|nr:MFS transporter [Muribaculaceae bacterium]
MSNGIGATFGTIAAGSIVNRWCHWEMVDVFGSGTPMRLFMGEWIYPWCIFAVYAFVVMLMWLIFFRNKID